jgi:hypothetical protein
VFNSIDEAVETINLSLVMTKAVIKWGQSHACMGYAEREQARRSQGCEVIPCRKGTNPILSATAAAVADIVIIAWGISAVTKNISILYTIMYQNVPIEGLEWMIDI